MRDDCPVTGLPARSLVEGRRPTVYDLIIDAEPAPCVYCDLGLHKKPSTPKTAPPPSADEGSR